jgi:hypothetical protein
MAVGNIGQAADSPPADETQESAGEPFRLEVLPAEISSESKPASRPTCLPAVLGIVLVEKPGGQRAGGVVNVEDL